MISSVFLTVILSLFFLLQPYSCLESDKSLDPKALENIFYNDIREVVKEITGDAENLDRLVKQLREIRQEAKRNRRSIDYTMAQLDPELSGDDHKMSTTTETESNANRGAPDSSQPGDSVAFSV
ncbi:uncharacterized protein LOC141856629 isoform X2 [Brevipalpus obovatus]|uniref:uncharacterized protein LOC141856629 isoform X2 n=1 Tax=Brevipalpus obovatus TaxID=246614 RepID=UPI003D9DE562